MAGKSRGQCRLRKAPDAERNKNCVQGTPSVQDLVLYVRSGTGLYQRVPFGTKLHHKLLGREFRTMKESPLHGPDGVVGGREAERGVGAAPPRIPDARATPSRTGSNRPCASKT